MDSNARIQDFDVARLQALVSRYPWFSYAREVLLCKLVEMEPECLESRYRENLVFLPRRDAVLLKCRRTVEAIREATGVEEDGLMLQELPLDVEEDLELLPDIEITSGEEVVESVFEVDLERDGGEDNYSLVKEKPKIFVVGGDYFSKEDFEELADEERAVQMKLGAPASGDDVYPVQQQQEDVQFDPMDFVTETLAAIYADQGYYEKAIEVYAKLILLYPEKSAYFASLVNEIKSKN